MDAILLDEITSAVREADDWFKKIGGSSRHWVDDCFLPMLKKRGIDIFKAQEVYDCESRLATVEAELEACQKLCAIYYEISAAAIGEEQTIALRDAAMRRKR